MFKPQPVVKRFYEGLEEGKFVALKCPECGHYEFPPRATCRDCGCFDMEWAEVSGEATIIGFVPFNASMGKPIYKQFKPYCVGEVRLKEGTEINAVIVGIPKDKYKEWRYKELPAKLITVQCDGFKYFAVQYVPEEEK